LEKLTYHAKPDEPAYGVDVQNLSAGVPGNAVTSMAGFTTRKSTSVSNSFFVGSLQPVEKPPRFNP
jgi:hypothetical protein